MTSDNSPAISRRRVLRTLGALGAAAASGALTIGRPRPAGAQTFGQQETVDDALKRLFAGRPLKDAGKLVKLDVPLIAENGAAVKVEVEATSPMTAANHVRHIYVIADKNRIPVITRVALSPASGQAYMAANVRLGESGDVRAIVEQSDGTLLQITREVKVTVGGCGG
ncbi:MAG: thiosulfate oxidation carrier protein SoxY [Candidatus Rokuibacteriota bacterium]